MRSTNQGADRGYAMAALLVALAVMGIMLGVAMPVWQTAVQREREAELIFRGEQYVQAIDLFSRRNGGYPTSLDALRAGRYIRRLYSDPMTDGDFQPVYLGQVAEATPGPGPAPGGQAGIALPGRGPTTNTQTSGPTGLREPLTPGRGAGPIVGVVSRSTGEALRLYNGRSRYNEWLFVSTAATAQPGAPGEGQPPGATPQPGRQGMPPGLRRGGPGQALPFGRPGGLPQ